MAFTLDLEVRDYELDQYGVVNNAVYLRYLEHARHGFLIALGMDAAQVARSGRSLALSEIHVAYRTPLRSRDAFTVTARIAAVSGARVTFAQAIHKRGEAKAAVEATAVAVFLDGQGRPQRVEGALRALFEKHLEPEAERASGRSGARPQGEPGTMAMTEAVAKVRALAFDVFGTVVDWRGSIVAELEAFGRAKGIAADWAAFTDAWRGLYQPKLSLVRDGKRPWTVLDVLHRESLEELLTQFRVAGLAEEEKDRLNRVWHRLKPWPDSVPGLNRLHAQYPLATLSNGNVALMVNLARHSGLPWDAILGAEVTGHYKPQPECYRKTAEMLGLQPAQVMLVAAHNSDLIAASKVGMRTAFVARPQEFGPHPNRDAQAEHPFDAVAKDLVDLAEQLGC